MRALVRKPVIDRNGTATTRWTKPEPVAVPARHIPAPDPVAPAPASTETLARFAAHAGEFFAGLDNHGNYEPERVAGLLKGYSAPTLLAIAADLRDSDRDGDRAVDTAAWIADRADDEGALRDLIAFRDVFEGGRDRGFVELAVGHLGQYSFLPATGEYSALPPEQVEGIRRILTTTEAHLGEWYDEQEEAYVEIVLPEDLARLVYDRSGDHGRINELVGRGIADAERIAMILDSEAPALADGII